MGNSLWEWSAVDRGRDILMLNSDMALVSDIDEHVDLQRNGLVQCALTREGCVEPSPVRSIANEYATDNQLWLDEFAEVFEKLITMGYDTDELSVVWWPIFIDISYVLMCDRVCLLLLFVQLKN